MRAFLIITLMFIASKSFGLNQDFNVNLGFTTASNMDGRLLELEWMPIENWGLYAGDYSLYNNPAFNKAKHFPEWHAGIFHRTRGVIAPISGGMGVAYTHYEKDSLLVGNVRSGIELYFDAGMAKDQLGEFFIRGTMKLHRNNVLVDSVLMTFGYRGMFAF